MDCLDAAPLTGVEGCQAFLNESGPLHHIVSLVSLRYSKFKGRSLVDRHRTSCIQIPSAAHGFEVSKLTDPCAYRPSGRIVAIPLQENREKYFLHDVFGVAFPAKNLPRYGKYHFAIVMKEKCEALCASILKSLDKQYISGDLIMVSMVFGDGLGSRVHLIAAWRG